MERLDIVLKKNGKDRLWLSEKLGIDRSTLSYRVNSKMIETIKETAKALDIEVAELFEPGENFDHVYLKDGYHGLKRLNNGKKKED